MCEYCEQDIFKREKFEEYTEDKNKTHIQSYLTNDNNLTILADWFDEFIQKRLAFGCNFEIKYCPWCGNKLIKEENKKETNNE